MSCVNVKKRYFKWLCEKAMNSDGRIVYSDLLSFLHGTRFTYVFDMDENRAIDGADLRYQFVTEYGYSDEEYMTLHETYSRNGCSVLEMMLALAIRCESILFDPEYGDRTSIWFYDMLESMGLSHLDNNDFNEFEALTIVNRFLNREYEANGFGGLFVVNDSRKDMRKREIWYQLMDYINKELERT